MVVWSLCVVLLLRLFRAPLRALIVLLRVLVIKVLEIVYRANTLRGYFFLFDYSAWLFDVTNVTLIFSIKGCF